MVFRNKVAITTGFVLISVSAIATFFSDPGADGMGGLATAMLMTLIGGILFLGYVFWTITDLTNQTKRSSTATAPRHPTITNTFAHVITPIVLVIIINALFIQGSIFIDGFINLYNALFLSVVAGTYVLTLKKKQPAQFILFCWYAVLFTIIYLAVGLFFLGW